VKNLTKAEEQLMKFLWKKERAYLKDLVDEYPEPKPAYTTISTVVNVLVKKGWIGFEKRGNAREYFPLLGRQKYLKTTFRGLLSGFFNDSPKQFASFFAQSDDITAEELKEIRQLIDEEIKKHDK